MSGELAPTDLVGGRIGKKTPQEVVDALAQKLQDAAEEHITVNVPVSEVDPTTVDPLLPLLVTNSGEVNVSHLLAGPQSIENIHAQLVNETTEWAQGLGRELDHVRITWEVKLQAIATTPVLVMPDQT